MQFRSLQITASVLFVCFCIKAYVYKCICLNAYVLNAYVLNAYVLNAYVYKCICCGYPFELHRQVDAIQMGTHNICIYKEKKKHKHIV